MTGGGIAGFRVQSSGLQALRLGPACILCLSGFRVQSYREASYWGEGEYYMFEFRCMALAENPSKTNGDPLSMLRVFQGFTNYIYNDNCNNA